MRSKKYPVVCFIAVLVLLSYSHSGFSQYVQENSDYTSLSVDGRERRYILYVPDGYKDKALPLVIVLHGGGGSGQKMRVGLGFDRYASRYGFAVAYPDAYISAGTRRSRQWNDGRKTLESYKQGIDDVHFIRAMIDDIAQRITLDKARIYVTGPSNGGMMTFCLALEAPELFAAAAPVIANIPSSLYNSSSHPSGMSILTINGTDDPFMPFNGGEGCKGLNKFISNLVCGNGGGIGVMSHEESIGVFAKVDGCSLNAETERLAPVVDDGTWIEKQVYNGCNDKYEVISYIVHGGGHAWPPRQPQLRASGKATGNLDATKEIVEFFMRHSKSQALS